MRHHGNPNWGKPTLPVPALPTGFEQQVEKLGLCPDEYRDSAKLRNWCLRNANQHYVPESLLKVWGIDVKEGWGSPTEYVLTTRRH
jgi:hypothetical protein